MLNIEKINVEVLLEENSFFILRDFSLDIKNGEIVGLAGESGSGKSILAKTILGLNNPPVVMTGGKILFNSKEVATEKDFRNIRGNNISMIFQNPSASLNPVMTIGELLIETLRLHDKNLNKKDAAKKARLLLESFEIVNAKERLKAYPHQLSGGMNQRVMIALAMASSPNLLIADEPTTALDVTIQTQIISLITKLNQEKNLSVLFISHDLSLLANVCSRVAILYCGELMEIVSSRNLKQANVSHPYTKALMECIPSAKNKNELKTIKGTIGRNDVTNASRCIFFERCDYSSEICGKLKPKFNGEFACHNPLKATLGSNN